MKYCALGVFLVAVSAGALDYFGVVHGAGGFANLAILMSLVLLAVDVLRRHRSQRHHDPIADDAPLPSRAGADAAAKRPRAMGYMSMH